MVDEAEHGLADQGFESPYLQSFNTEQLTLEPIAVATLGYNSFAGVIDVGEGN
jgi:hypothetical protein